MPAPSTSMPPLPEPARPAPARRDPGQAERLLQRLDWQVIRRLDGLLQGDHRALFYGSGSDFADLREYQPPDDVRYIDWNVTARLDTPYVRQYIDDRELTAWLLLDRSSSMRFGHVERTKEVVLAELAATLGRLLTRDGNRIGAVLYDNTIERIIDRCGRDHRSEWAVPRRTHHDPAPVAGLRPLRFHQQPRVGTDARDAGATSRGRRGPTVGRTRGRAGRRGRGRVAGLRDRGAAPRRHQRPALPAAVPGRGPGA